MRSDDVPSVCRLSGFLNVSSWQRRLQQPPRCEILRHGDARAHVSRKRRRCLTRDRSFLCISGVVRRSRMSTKKSNKQYLGSRLLLPPDKYEVRGSPSPIISFHSPFIRSPPVRFVLNFQPHRREGRQEGREKTSSSSIIHNSHSSSSCCPLHTREIEREGKRVDGGLALATPRRVPHRRRRRVCPSSEGLAQPATQRAWIQVQSDHQRPP